MPRQRIIDSLPTLLLTFLLTACSGLSTAGSKDYEPDSFSHYRSWIGQASDDVLEKVDAEIESTESDRGMYRLSGKETFDGRDFDVWFLFDLEEDTLYGFQYRLAGDDPQETAASAKHFLDAYIKAYGEPDTYPELPGRLSEAEDLEAALSAGSPFEAHETWMLDADDDFMLNVRVRSDGAQQTALTLEYQTEHLPD